jgi:hypothetical protein
MPKEKPFTSLIANIYKRNYEDIGMFFFVEAQRMLVPAVTIEQAVDNYFRYLGIKDFNHDSAVATYSKLKREFYEAQKT